MTDRVPTVLMIMDGWGWREEHEANAVRLARTPNFDRLWAECPHAFLTTCGEAVGLPDGQMGNSEVGHLNIGAGRIVMQELPRIDRAVGNGELARRIEESGLPAALKRSGGACHLIGLMSEGGVHGHIDHAIACARILFEQGVPVIVHAITDGRDMQPGLASGHMRRLTAALPEGATVATVSGRYFAMDRDNRWERVRKAYEAIAHGKGVRAASAVEAVEKASGAGQTDEFIEPRVVGTYEGIAEGDAILSINFRSDRMREILSALTHPEFDGFDRGRPPQLAAAVGMVSYGDDLQAMKILFEPQTLKDGLAETVSKAGRTQIHLAETEKYPHVTYFLNGGAETPFVGEERVLVPSPQVATYDLQPEMSAPELCDRVVEAVEGGRFDLVVVNFANPDMVGHTGSLDAATKAVETVDDALGRIEKAVRARNGNVLATADHGNCEMMIDPGNGKPHTAHTLFPVPVILSSPRKGVTLRDGILADLAPTILALMGIEQPDAMSGTSLLA